MFKKIMIKGKKVKLIKTEGVWYYKNHYCHCGCCKRICFKKCHSWYGIPKYIPVHQMKQWRYKIGMTGYWKGKPKTAKHKRNISRTMIKNGTTKGKNNPRYIDGLHEDRKTCKQRGLGFIPLNERTKEANSLHHINEELVIYIPRKLHFHVKHSIKTGKNMKLINQIAFYYLYEFYYEKNHNWQILLNFSLE